MAEKQGLTYQKLTNGLGGLKTFRRCTLLNVKHRQALRTLVDKIEDITRPTTTKIGSLQEEYKELKSHKSVIDSEDKMKKLLKDMDKEINSVIDKFKTDVEFAPVGIGKLFDKCEDDEAETKNEKAAFWPLYVELEGVFLTTETDDGGEPKKGGGGGNG